MKALIERLQSTPAVEAFFTPHQTVVCSETMEEALLLAAAYRKHPEPMIVVKSNLYAAQRLHDRLQTLLGDHECLLFPADESFRIEALASSPEMVVQRVFVLSQLRQGYTGIVITHTAAVVRYLAPVARFDAATQSLKVGQTIARDTLLYTLHAIGYERSNKIEHSLQYAVRGSVLDIFSVNQEAPLRIEFFGDTIESLRFFELGTQRTTAVVDTAEIIAASDLLLNGEMEVFEALYEDESNQANSFLSQLDDHSLLGRYAFLYKHYEDLVYTPASLLDYAPQARLVLSDFSRIEATQQRMVEEQYDYFVERNESIRTLQHPVEILRKMSDRPRSFVEEFHSNPNAIVFHSRSTEAGLGSSRRNHQILETYRQEGRKIVLCYENDHQKNSVMDWLKEWEWNAEPLDIHVWPTHPISLAAFGLPEGFELPDLNVVYFSARELFGAALKPGKNFSRYRDGTALTSADHLQEGDYVVHEHHGIGQYLGLVTLENDGIHRDYLHLAYRGKDVLYVPLEQFRLVRKYVSKEGVVPKLNKLGSEEWLKTKKRIKTKISDIAERLLTLYRERVSVSGFAFPPDDEWQRQFEQEFPYELTEDQLRSLAEIKVDMEQPYPMDRLLCGDVGFGKTEVAFLAAFKAILGGKQVAFLCPTTLLARQHYETAKQRFQNVPIGIGMLSRFVPPAVQKKTLSELKEGRLSMLIGTHRLLSNDLVFRDLGLLIVDEEQRFGVEHKEKIKELKRNIDVLTLSATPIPRTMQMALLGVRNLSQIETPPLHRLPVQTYVMEKNPRLIKEVIERELGRGGQVFYLCNEIDALPGIAATLQKQIPGANIIIIHGQMDRDDIEDAMIRFQAGEANVMVCTTIIENGIDIPNANTIVVDRADTFGLAQLYQIKGRVGRSDRLAYAYLLYRPRKQLSEVAIKRLRSIKEFVELGSGYRIAMRDLSIRGAGDILGAEQAGFIDTVGIDLYLQLLQETIEEKRTGIPTPEPEVPRPLQVDAYIPKPYTNDDLDKIELYKKIDAIQDLEGLSTLQEMMRDVYGKLPLSVELLLEKRRLELTLRNELVEEVKDSANAYEIVFTPTFSSYDGVGIDLFRIANQLSNHLLLSYRGGRIRMKLHKEEPEWLKLASRFLEKTWQLVQRYQTGQPH